MARETFSSLPQASAAQAIAYLDEQRSANGIPGNLVEDPVLNLGCEQLTNIYVAKPGQYAHEEVIGQPGYTPAGNEAAASSDLGGRPGEWSATLNPWWDFPLHLTALLDPAATTAWYGESYHKFPGGASCMGTSGERTFPVPTFFSAPGENATNVPPSLTVGGELPFSVGEAVGIRQGITTGPNILLWPEGSDVTLQNATLRSPNRQAAIRLVTPETPAPPTPPGEPIWKTIGGTASFVIPVHALTPTSPIFRG